MAIRFRFVVSDDKRTVAFKWGDEENMLGATSIKPREIDKLISILITARAQMVDEVPAEFEPEEKIDVIENPRYTLGFHAPSRSTFLTIRHPGAGWLSFLFPESSELLQRLRRGPPPDLGS